MLTLSATVGLHPTDKVPCLRHARASLTLRHDQGQAYVIVVGARLAFAGFVAGAALLEGFYCRER